jgi:hypothetical protein
MPDNKKNRARARAYHETEENRRIVTIRHNRSRLYFTVAKWRIFYVSQVENILRRLGGQYFTVARCRIFYGWQVEYILRIPGREYFTVDG